MRGEYLLQNQTLGASHIVPHPRTLHKAREQVKWMVADGVSRPKIKRYLIRWLCWWVRTSGTWNHKELSNKYIESCWTPSAAENATEFLQHYLTSPSNLGECETGVVTSLAAYKFSKCDVFARHKFCKIST